MIGGQGPMRGRKSGETKNSFFFFLFLFPADQICPLIGPATDGAAWPIMRGCCVRHLAVLWFKAHSSCYVRMMVRTYYIGS